MVFASMWNGEDKPTGKDGGSFFYGVFCLCEKAGEKEQRREKECLSVQRKPEEEEDDMDSELL